MRDGSGSEKCIKFEGEGLPAQTGRRAVVVDKPALKVMARESTREGVVRLIKMIAEKKR